jgi:hypothetical protein
MISGSLIFALEDTTVQTRKKLSSIK